MTERTEREAKINLLVMWLSDMMKRVEDTDDRKVLTDTIEFLRSLKH